MAIIWVCLARGIGINKNKDKPMEKKVRLTVLEIHNHTNLSTKHE